MRQSGRSGFAGLLLVTAILGCGGETGVDPNLGTLHPAFRLVELTYIGQSVDLVVVARDRSGVTIPDGVLSFVSRNPVVASVTTAGRLLAGSAGSAVVVVSAACCATDSITVTVLGRGRLDMTPAALNFTALGQATTLSVVARDFRGAAIATPQTVAFSSLNEGVATVNSVGQVISQGLGATLILATGICCGPDSTSVNVGVTPPPPAGLLISAKWSTATGNTAQAVTDGGKAITRWCVWQDVLRVVTGGPVNWTLTPNVLSVRSIQGCGHVEFENLFPLPATAEQFWAVRYYTMNGTGQTDTEQHPHTFWPVGAIEAIHSGYEPLGGQNGNWYLRASWGAGNYNQSESGTGGPRFPWYPMDGTSVQNRRILVRDVWYRYEFILHWMNATQYRVYPRLYDMAGNLLNDETTWRHSDGAGSFAQYYAAGGFFTRGSSSTNPNNIRTLSFGRGQAGSSGAFYYIADFAAALVANNTSFIGAASP